MASCCLFPVVANAEWWVGGQAIELKLTTRQLPHGPIRPEPQTGNLQLHVWKCGKNTFIEQSGPQKVFSPIWALEAEVNNGRFSQYFFNDCRETAGFAVEALKSVGARQAAELCRQAKDIAFPAGLTSVAGVISSVAADFSEESDSTCLLPFHKGSSTAGYGVRVDRIPRNVRSIFLNRW
jgi:hypothetical protein